MHSNKGLVKSLVTLSAILMLSSAAMAGNGHGPGDGTCDSTDNNGPGDRSTTQILTIDNHQLFAGNARGGNGKGSGDQDGGGQKGSGDGECNLA